MRLKTLPDKPMYDVICLCFLLAVLFGINLGGRPYSAPSESRYIEIGREMAESGDFVTPRLDYVKYFEKPPLFYWIQAASTRFIGFEPFSARVPTALFALALCLLTYGLTRMLYGRLAGWLSAMVFATSLYLFALSRIVLLDVPVSFFIAATLTCFLYAIDMPARRNRTAVIYLMYLAAAGAVLTKGLIGVVLPGGVIFLWLALTGHWRLLKEMRLASGIVLFLIVSVPWHILVSLRNPEFPHFYFIHEHFQRYLTREAGRYQPIWFFVAVLLAGLFPWTVFLAQATLSVLRGFWRDRHTDGKTLYLMIWGGLIFLFFSLSDSKLIPYILPVFPVLAAWLGNYLARVWSEEKVAGFGAGLAALIAMLVVFAFAPSFLLGVLNSDSKVAAAIAQGQRDVSTLSIASMIGAGLLLIIYIQGRPRHVILSMLAIAAVLAQLGDVVAAHYNKDSMNAFSSIINSAPKPGDEVAMYQTYYQDMPLYVKKRITLADWKGELEFGSHHEDTSAWMIDVPTFWQRWMKKDHRMFVVMREDTFARLTKDKKPEDLHLYYLHKDGRNFLFMNSNPLEALQERKK